MAAPAGDAKMDKMEKGMKAKTTKTAGELTAVDEAGKKGTLKGKDGKEWSFTWDDKTVVTPKGGAMTVGMMATVTHAADSDVAMKVQLHKAKKMSKKMDKMEKKSS